MVQFLLDPTEAAVLDLTTTIGFGELLNVRLSERPRPSTSRSLSDYQMRFILLVRKLELKEIHKITVHNHDPVMIEIGGELNGTQFLQKIKL